MEIKCYICNNNSKYLCEKDGFDLYMCKECSLVEVYPMPKEKYLKEEIYSKKSGYQQSETTDLSKVQESDKEKNIFKYLNKTRKKGDLLDVGCSNGKFMFLAKNKGFNVYGVELNEFTANIAKNNGLKVFKGTLKEAKFEDEYFDVINLGDVIEHVQNPKKLVDECRKILKKDGVLIVSTPNMDCFWSNTTLCFMKIFKIPWSSCTPPHHLFQFSKNNLDKLMKKSNMINIKTWYKKVPDLKYELGSLGLYQKWKKTKKIKDLIHMIFPFGIYLIIYIIDYLLVPFKYKDFSMCCVYKKI